MFHCSIPRVRNPGNHHTRESLKGFLLCALVSSPTLSTLSLFLSFSLSHTQLWVLNVSLFISLLVLVHLPRVRTSAPRRPPALPVIRSAVGVLGAQKLLVQLSDTGVNPHHSAGFWTLCPRPTLQTSYIYTNSYYWSWVPTVPKSLTVSSTCLFQKSLTNIIQISILIQIKK